MTIFKSSENEIKPGDIFYRMDSNEYVLVLEVSPCQNKCVNCSRIVAGKVLFLDGFRLLEIGWHACVGNIGFYKKEEKSNG